MPKLLGPDGLLPMDRKVLRLVARGMSRRAIARKLRCSTSQVQQAMRRKAAPGFLERERAKLAAQQGELPEQLRTRALEAKLEGDHEAASELEERAAAREQEIASAGQQGDVVLPLDDPALGLVGGVLTGAAGLAAITRARREADPAFCDPEETTLDALAAARAKHDALAACPRSRSLLRAVHLATLDAHRKLGDPERTSGVGIAAAAHCGWRVPSRPEVYRHLEAVGEEPTPANDAAYVARWAWETLARLAPTEAPEEHEEEPAPILPEGAAHEPPQLDGPPEPVTQAWLDQEAARIARLLDEARAGNGDALESVRLLVESHPGRLLMALHGQARTFHWEAHENALQHREVLWLATRGAGKTTSYSEVLSAWLATSPKAADLFAGAERPIDRTNIRVAIISNSADVAKRILWNVREHLLGPVMGMLYGDLQGRRWREAESDTAFRSARQREATFTALGVGSVTAGGHYDLLVADDWVTYDSTRTPLLRQRTEDYWAFTVAGTKEGWTRTVAAGTRYHPADFWQRILEWHEKGEWAHVQRTPALVSIDGSDPDYTKPETLRSFWEESKSVDWLLATQKTIGLSAFASQFQMDASLLSSAFFQSDYTNRVQRWEDVAESERQHGVRTVLGVDPAFAGGSRNDFTGMCVVSIVGTTPPSIHVRHALRVQCSEEQMVGHMVALCRQFHVSEIAFESIGNWAHVIQMAESKLYRVRIVAEDPRKYKRLGISKEGRASQVRVLMERGWLWFEPPSEHNGVERLLHELAAFPSNSGQPGADDLLDAWVWACLRATRFRSRTRLVKTGRNR